jgi:hypothetical protein
LFCPRLIYDNISNEINNELKYLEERAFKIRDWDKYGVIIKEYIEITDKHKNAQIKIIEQIIKKVENIYFDFGYATTILTFKNIILYKLRTILNEKINEYNKNHKVKLQIFYINLNNRIYIVQLILI